MARTTPTEVRKIIDTTLDDTTLDAYVESANELVTEVLGTDTTIPESLKTVIETWLAAHLLASTREQQLSEAQAGSAKAKYQGESGMGLDSTMYGQQVLILDTTGNFASLGGKAVIVKAVESF